jgi:hypothetical protein
MITMVRRCNAFRTFTRRHCRTLFDQTDRTALYSVGRMHGPTACFRGDWHPTMATMVTDTSCVLILYTSPFVTQANVFGPIGRALFEF